MRRAAGVVLGIVCVGHLAGCGGPGTIGPMPDGGSVDGGAVTPTVHASALGQPEELLLDDRALVWANATQGTIMILDLATDEVRTLATGVSGPDHALAMTATHVYWAGWRAGEVMRVPREGGAPEVVATIGGSALPTGMAISPTHVYWTLFGGALQRAPLEGGAVEDLAWEVSVNPRSPVIRDDHLYVAASTGEVRRLRIGPAPDAALSSTWEVVAALDGLDGPSVIAVDDAYVYGGIVNDSIVFRAPRDGGDTEVLATGLQPSDLALAGGWIYLARAGAYGLARMRVTGGPIESVVSEPSAWSVAVGGGRVFWSTHESVDSFDGTVKSIPQP